MRNYEATRLLKFLGLWILVVGLIGMARANAADSSAILVTIAESPGQQSSTVSGVAVFDFESLTSGRHSDVEWPGVGVLDELLVHEGYFGFGALDPSDGLNSRFNWNGWPGWSGNDPVVSATIITLDERSAYFGLYWTAGDGDDIIRFYDGDTLVAEFSTQHVVQSAHLTSEYYGDPNHNNQWQPHLRYNHTEPYAYINFYGDANTKWDKVVLTQTHDRGSGFETDNLSSRVDPVLSSTDDISSISKAVASVSGTETTLISDTSTWSFEEASASETLTYSTASSAEIISTISDTVGSNYVVVSSGSSANTTSWSEGTVGKFEININGETRFLTVDADNIEGLDPDGDSLMVVQTVDSQGLTDSGTLSIYFRPTESSFIADITFSFWEDEDATIPLNPNIQITVLDLDHDQKFEISNDSFNSYHTYTNSSNKPTKVTADVGGSATEFQGSGSSSIDNPLNAVSLLTNSEQVSMTFSHTAVYLAMFEFRNPSTVLSTDATPDSDGDGQSDDSEGVETGTVNIVETTNEETTSTETESGETTSETETTESESETEVETISTETETTESETETETEVETTESETYYGSEVLIANTKAIVQNYSGMPLSSGNQIEYTVTFSNTGTDAVSNLTLTGLVPDNTTYVVDSLTVDDVAYAIDPTNGLVLASLDASSSVVLKLIVEVNASLPTDAVWISSSVNGTYDENPDITIVADNNVQGHCGIREDGFDDLLDNGWDVGDDDPTKLPLLQGTTYEDCLLAYEDLKNKGWNDWDMNDIILRIFSFYVVNGANQITHLSVHQQIIARGAGMDSKLFITLPHNGIVDWHATYSSSEGVLESVESDVSMDGPLTVRLWESSKDALPPFTELKHKWGAANTERFDSTGEGKIAVLNVYFHEPARNPLDTYSISPHDTWIRASSNEEIHLLQYDSSSSQVVLNALSPLFGRSLPFGAVFDIDWVWPAEGQPIWLSHPEYSDYILSGGSQFTDWHLNFNIWRVWWDDEGMMNNGQFNNASSSSHWNNYVETWSD